MIGLGTKDDADYAVDFVESTGTYSFPMYWDETSSAWAPSPPLVWWATG